MGSSLMPMTSSLMRTTQMNEGAVSRGGRTTILTLELARKIVKLIERMPDAEIPVTWASVEIHVRKKFGHALKRNVLSTKEFGGRKLIYDAYTTALEVQKRLQTQVSPKYNNSSRAVLRERLRQVEAHVLALQQQLDEARLSQLTQLDLYRVTKFDLRQASDRATGGST